MQGRRSHNLELIVYDLEIERTRKRLLRQVRAQAQIEGAMANEETKALKEFTAPTALTTSSCIVVAPILDYS